MSLHRFIIPIILISTLLVGCVKIEKIYTWDRNASESFELQYKLQNNQITLLTNYIDNGVRKEGNIRILNYFKPCEVFDENNWVCPTITDLEKIEMKDGQLTWFYWKEVRNYKKSYKLVY